MSQPQDIEVPPTSFRRFMRLPPEIRLMVWDCCIPSRPVGVLWLPKAKYNWTDDLGNPAGIHARAKVPPLISRVCFEARKHIYKRGNIRTMSLKGGRMWFDDKFDSIHLDPQSYPTFLLEDAHGIQNHHIPPDLRQRVNDPRIPISIYLPFWQWPFITGRPLDRTELSMEFIRQRSKCDVVHDLFELDLDYADACNCGFFGPFAESSPAFMNLSDRIQIEKLRRAIIIMNMHGRRDYSAQFSDIFYDPTRQRTLIDQFERRIAQYWAAKFGQGQASTMPEFNYVIELRWVQRRAPHVEDGLNEKDWTLHNHLVNLY
ncbi:hypothetical protein GGR57DRAFT_120201 [Xylariaceae sp. FL1272]|nr:hypothetical protein GGR57DRAFT_120201 [Xylariaceae sp. FL1272]